jgi:hypothetical protein
MPGTGHLATLRHSAAGPGPSSGLLGSDAALTSSLRIERRMLLRAERVLALQLDNLLRFNRPFSSGWLPHVITEHRAELPRVAIVATAAEGYLPHASLIRGPGWSRPAAPAGART